MVKTCSAYGCTNRASKDSSISFHSFPLNNKELSQKWIAALRRVNFQPTSNSSVCSDHFLPSDYIDPESKKPKLKQDSIPSVFNFPKHLLTRKTLKRKLTRKETVSNDEDEEQPTTAKKMKTNPTAAVSPRKKKLLRKIKSLKQKVKRRESKIKSLKSLVDKLEEENLLASDAAHIIKENFSGLKSELFNSELRNQDLQPKSRRYSDELKKFALTLHFYSPRAYGYVRTLFSLPCPSSLSHWTSSINCEPGFFKDVFLYLQNKSKGDESNKDCALIFDAMYIKSGLIYNKSTGSYEGYANFGQDVLAFNTDDVAKEALVFMLVGLKGHWKCPIGYVLYNGLNASNLSSLVNKALELCSSYGINVYSVTCDGTATNFDSMRSLGCIFGTKLSDINGSFSCNFFDHKLFFIADACHMLKLARNALADVKVFIDKEGNKIKWEHINSLHKIQEEEGLKFGNKLGRSHVEFQRHKMNVKVAAQTLSSSVADALEYLMLAGHPDFIDASGTIKFIRTIDHLFDLMNSRSPFGKGYKKPLFLHEKAMWQRTIKQSIDYLLDLKVSSGQRLITHRRKVFVLGLIVTAKSIQQLAELLLTRQDNPYKYILTYKLSQDHLELLFACIRGKNGFNNNPDVFQFKSSLRRILLRNSIIGSKHSNCLAFEECSTGSIFSLKWNNRNSPLIEREDDLTEDDKRHVDELCSKLDSFCLSNYKEAILGYIAGFVVKKVVKDISCSQCTKALYHQPATANDHHYSHFSDSFYLSLINVKNRGGLTLPSRDVHKIIHASEKAFRVAVSGIDSKHPKISSRKNIKGILINTINQQLLGKDIFCSLNQHDLDHEIHAEDLHSSQLSK